MEEERSTVEVPKIGHDFNKKKRSEDVLVTGEKAVVDFRSMNISQTTLEGLAKCGFQRPSPIQAQAIPYGSLGFDLLLQAKSGTGKTCVFTVIAIDNVDHLMSNVQVVIIAPSREIAYQNKNAAKLIGVHKEGLKVKAFIGGTSVGKDVSRLSRCHIAVGTPGRLAHMVRDYAMDLTKVKLVVLDEADKLLEGTFYTELQEIFNVVPKIKQVIAVSATYPSGLDDFLVRWMRNPLRIQLGSSVLLAVDQYGIDVRNSMNYHKHGNYEEAFKIKFNCLKEVLERVPFTQVIVFSQSQLRAEKFCTALEEEDYDAVLLSGALAQDDRLESLIALRSGSCRIMVATDVAARGIDSELVDLVINLECPEDLSTYLHRIGRGGRFGASAIAITLLMSTKDFASIEAFESTVHKIHLIEDLHSLDNLTPETAKFHLPSVANSSSIKEEPVKGNWAETWKKLKSYNGDYPIEVLTAHGSIDIDVSNVSKYKQQFLTSMSEPVKPLCSNKRRGTNRFEDEVQAQAPTALTPETNANDWRILKRKNLEVLGERLRDGFKESDDLKKSNEDDDDEDDEFFWHEDDEEGNKQ